MLFDKIFVESFSEGWLLVFRLNYAKKFDVDNLFCNGSKVT